MSSSQMSLISQVQIKIILFKSPILVLDKEKVFSLLTSPDRQYESFTTTILKPPRPSYTELISQLKNFDQRQTWFLDKMEGTLTHLAFYGQHQNSTRPDFFNFSAGSNRSDSNQVSSSNRINNNRFSSIERGFQAQRSQNNNMIGSQQRHFPPPGERRMTAEE